MLCPECGIDPGSQGNYQKVACVASGAGVSQAAVRGDGGFILGTQQLNEATCVARNLCPNGRHWSGRGSVAKAAPMTFTTRIKTVATGTGKDITAIVDDSRRREILNQIDEITKQIWQHEESRQKIDQLYEELYQTHQRTPRR
jgi:hypothetical protein